MLAEKPRTRWQRWARTAREFNAELARMRAGEDGGLLEQLFIPLVFVVMLAPLPLWPLIRHGEWNQDMGFTFRHATLPVFLALLPATRIFMPREWASSTWPGRLMLAGLLTIIITFLAQVHVGAINRWYGESRAVVISGTVLDKIDNEGTYGVRVRTTDGEMKLRISRDEHDRLVEGGRFAKRYMRGSLGRLYRDD